LAESTLNLTFADLQARVGRFLGYGRGVDFGEPAWDVNKTNDIMDCVRSGYHQFLYPSPREGEANSYDWSFLHPVGTFTFAQGASTVTLPDDFGGFENQLSLLTDNTTSMPWQIEWQNEGKIRQQYSVTPTMTGPPQYACERPIKGTNAVRSQRFELFVFPLADREYTIQGQYYLQADAMTNALPFAYGGAAHAETILQSCLAMAELKLDDAKGPQWATWQERLSASISIDRKHKPAKLGYNRDDSDRAPFNRQNVHWWAPAATYNGMTYQ